MSIATQRQEIAAQLGAVEGVTGYPYRPKVPKPGDAWTTLPSMELQAGLVWRPTWTVMVFLPQDERAASMWLDEHFDAIALALRGGATFPESAEPALMKVEGNDWYVLEFTIRSH